MPKDDQTHPVINVEETIGKTVGKRTQKPDVARSAKRIQRLARRSRNAFGASLCPKGVYRFHTHEEADEWLIIQMAKAAAAKS